MAKTLSAKLQTLGKDALTYAMDLWNTEGAYAAGEDVFTEDELDLIESYSYAAVDGLGFTLERIEALLQGGTIKVPDNMFYRLDNYIGNTCVGEDVSPEVELRYLEAIIFLEALSNGLIVID